MQRLAAACEAIAGTTKKLLKTGIVAEYLKSRMVEEAAVSAVFLSGRAFPAWEETTLQVGGRSLWQMVAELAGADEGQLTASYRRHGDLGAVAGELLPARAGQGWAFWKSRLRFGRSLPQGGRRRNRCWCSIC